MKSQTNGLQTRLRRSAQKVKHRANQTLRIAAATAVMCSAGTWAQGLAEAHAESVQFSAAILPGTTNLVGQTSLNLTVTVTQLGDYAHAETHALPSHVHLVYTDMQNHRYDVIGVLQHPVKAVGGNGFQFVGVYSVPVPNPTSSLSNVSLKLDAFAMQDVGGRDRDGDDDDAVHGAQYAGVLSISPAPPNFSANIVPATSSLVGNSNVDVTMTVTQNGDSEDPHSLPGNVWFRWFDSQHHAWTVKGTLKSQSHNAASPGASSQYVGVYTVPIPNPSNSISNVSLQADGFAMVDLNHGGEGDDSVHSNVYNGTVSISPAPPTFTASISPTSTNLVGNNKVDVNVTIAQSGDTEEGHALPSKIQFDWVDGQSHQWSATGVLKSPVSSPGGNGYRYVGDYVVSVPNPTQTLTNVVLKADGFTMLDTNHGSDGDDHVASSQFAGVVNISPAPPDFTATIVPSGTGLVGDTKVDVTLTVAQAGDIEEAHGLPKQIQFDWVDAAHHVVSVTGSLKSPVSSAGGVGSRYQGVYSVPVPNPKTPWTGVSLQFDQFRMSDVNHGGESDDVVAPGQYAGPFTINPAPPNFTASIIPSTNTVTGSSLLAVTAIVTQNGDVENNESHALPAILQFSFTDSEQHSWTVTGKLVSPVSAHGAVGFQYQGVYLVPVPNPSTTVTNVTLKARAFTMIDGNHGSNTEDSVAAVQAANLLTITPKS